MRTSAPPKIGRNDPCPCGSGRKYKHCCFNDRAPGAGGRGQPQSALALLQAAAAFDQAGRLFEAAAGYRQAIALKPNLAGAHYNLGNVLQAQGEMEEAIASYRRALEIEPEMGETYCNLGSALRASGRPEEAIAVYRSGLAVLPQSALLHFNLGNALKDASGFEEAITCYRKALTIDPGMIDVYVNLGLAEIALGKAGEAVDTYRKALSLGPAVGDIHVNMGVALAEKGRSDEAIASYRKAIALDPNRQGIYTNLGVALAEQGRAEEALASYRQAQALKPEDPGPYANQVFLSAYQALTTPQDYLALARGWERIAVPATEREAARRRRFAGAAPSGARLRVGYVSGDFRRHPVSFFIEQVFAHHDRARVELHAYSTVKQRDAVTARFEAMTEHWQVVAGLSESELRDRIEADRIDVLIDLGGYTVGGRLGTFARRAAPVQVSYLGYFASTGLTEMDYWIGDEIVTPVEHDGHFCEKLWRLPRTWVAFGGHADAPAPAWRPDEGGAVRIGSFTDIKKISAETLALWAKALHALPEGRLLLKNRQLEDAANRQRILDTMAVQGIAGNRIDLVSGEATVGWAEHMSYYDRLDIGLDPVRVMTGSTTTCDALWMGVPVVTLTGDRAGSRMSTSKLHALGHAEWIAATEEEYVGKVVALARDAERRKQVRLGLREEMARSALCDAAGLAKNLEDAYAEMRLRAASG